MRSLRRSLTVYLLALFAVALGGVGLLVDRVIVDALAAREATIAGYINEQYKDRRRDHMAKIDEAQLTQARDLGHQMQVQYLTQFQDEIRKFNLSFAAVQLAVPPQGLGPLLWTWLGNDARQSSAYSRLSRSYFTHLQIEKDFIAHVEKQTPDEKVPHFIQINRPSSKGVWRSDSLGDVTLPFDAAYYDTSKMALWDWRLEPEIPLADGRKVRRVVLKVPVLSGGNFRIRGGAGRGPNSAGTPPGQPAPPPPSPDQIVENTPRIYVIVARPVQSETLEYRDEIEWREAELEKNTIETRQSLLRIRAVLLGAGLLGFLAVALGGPYLIGRGLRPVNALSEAVGRVSEKDFLLPIAQADLSRELVPIHARLTATLDQLKRAFSREKQSVADISHELRTPVAALLATLDVSLRKPRSAEQYRQTIADCRAITKQLGQLVERVMTLAYLDAGHASVSACRVDAGELAAGCAAVIRPLAEAHGLTFTVVASPDIEVNTDPDKLREVLMNLLHNAVEYNSPGGCVELAVNAGADGRAVLAVRDTGIGMTDDVRGKIFERFYRADDSRTATGVHAGLGLAIVKEYIDRLGGRITVESTPGTGSLFRVELPRAETLLAS